MPSARKPSSLLTSIFTVGVERMEAFGAVEALEGATILEPLSAEVA